MPRRNDLRSVVVVGSGPIVIGQACEFDYSGTQACRALREEGLRVVLINSNPASIMTDPEIADRTYLEPLHPDYVCAILERERPDALLPTVGGQTALNLAITLHETGVLERFGVELIGAGVEAIHRAESRESFDACMRGAGLVSTRGGQARTVAEARALGQKLGLPVIVRPSFTLGGSGGGTASTQDAFEELVTQALRQSPLGEVRIEEALVGWKEFELEVVRDARDNAIVVCSIENVDPMGVHTGDSVTVAQAMTLSDREYQKMRDWGLRCIRAIGVETGGSNVQFAVHPGNGDMRIIEMNPRVSRSSALASKATGFPIARVATKLAIGYTLDEIPNDVTGSSCAAFEPALDYVVVKVPRWDFEKFHGSSDVLGVQMHSVGEAMAIGRSFREALQKGMRSLELGWPGLDPIATGAPRLAEAHPKRLQEVAAAFELHGLDVDTVAAETGIDPWFLHEIAALGELRAELRASAALAAKAAAGGLDAAQRQALEDLMWRAKRDGFSDSQIAALTQCDRESLRALRAELGLRPVYKVVDTCAGEFAAETPYYYGTWERENESQPGERPRVVVLGSGPNRIGQGIEFDYCCVQAVQAARELGYDAIMINCNPETVSTDFDVASKLYFEPLDLEAVLDVLELERPEGVLVQFGGQTPLRLSHALQGAGFEILGTSTESIDVAEDRGRFADLAARLRIPIPDFGTASDLEGARTIARRIGFPLLVRPSYVLGGRGMRVLYDARTFEEYVRSLFHISPASTLLIDRFVEDAFEFDVDALSDGESTYIAGVMQHIEEAGVHSGDSECLLPPYVLPAAVRATLEEYTRRIAQALSVRGLINMQFAVLEGTVYVLEANPRASRTVPFVSKTLGLPLARLATQIALGARIQELDLPPEGELEGVAIKNPVFPFRKFPAAGVFLGPEMRSTGEVMGWAPDVGQATLKAWIASNERLPIQGNAYISLNEADKRRAAEIGSAFQELGFALLATAGTCRTLQAAGLSARPVMKVNEGKPDVADEIAAGNIQLIVNTPLGMVSRFDENAVGRTAVAHGVPMVTTLSGALALARAIRTLREGRIHVLSLQERLQAWGRALSLGPVGEQA
ncbi:MAG: carbamoyl-phosphate synthase large subunit [Candidatus Latescibacterota bacterium]|nr:MAG: carbamoyl-phosphate synthase large subunit [Candidatus Latescibacterota bacterium]